MASEYWLLIGAALMWAMHDVVPWRKGWTWLPPFLLGTGGWLNLDGYHITGALMRHGFLNAGWFAAGGLFSWDLVWFNLIAWVLAGAVMDVSYHWLLMKPGFWFKSEENGGAGW